jgi:hypothetical protein
MSIFNYHAPIVLFDFFFFLSLNFPVPFVFLPFLKISPHLKLSPKLNYPISPPQMYPIHDPARAIPSN